MRQIWHLESCCPPGLLGLALTALLTEVIRNSVCSHLMTTTAQQASAIALCHANAPIFEVADYALVADLFEAVADADTNLGQSLVWLGQVGTMANNLKVAEVHDQAVLAEGGALEDPASFVKRLNKLILDGLGAQPRIVV